VRLSSFWDVESDDEGSFAWTKAQSTLTLSGLPPEVPLKVTLYVRYTGPASSLAVASADGERREVAVSNGGASPLSQAFRADSQGRLLVRLAAPTFRPSDLGRPTDPRELGVALSGVELRPDASAAAPSHN
jgi:hypothetical protein